MCTQCVHSVYTVYTVYTVCTQCAALLFTGNFLVERSTSELWEVGGHLALPGEVTEVFFVFRPRRCRSSRIAYTKNKAGRSECESGMAAWPWHHGMVNRTSQDSDDSNDRRTAAAGCQAAVLEAAEKRGLQSTGGSPIGTDTKAFGPFGYRFIQHNRML